MRASLVAMAGRDRTKRVRRADAFVSFLAFFEGGSWSNSKTGATADSSSERRCLFRDSAIFIELDMTVVMFFFLCSLIKKKLKKVLDNKPDT